MDHLKKFFARIDFLFLSLVLGVILLNLPYLKPAIVPHHDTLYDFQLFYFFYNEYFFNHTIAQWIPYGVYGIPANLFQLGALVPADYLFMFLGKLLGIQDVLLLFKFTIIFEQLIFLSGLYLLVKFLFNNEKAVIGFVCIAAFCSMGWFHQVFFNLRIFELFPFLLYFLFLFFERRRAIYFWLAGITGIIWSVGAGYYFSFLWFFLGFCIFAVLLTFQRNAWKDIRPRFKSDTIVMGCFLLLLALFVLFLINSFHGIISTHRSEGGANSLTVFLAYGRIPSFTDILQWFLLGSPIYIPIGSRRDNTVYVGLATIFFFIWAVLSVRKKYFLAILGGTIVLVWLSLGGVFANFVYFFPFMKYYRHIGLTLALVKICLALGAGFGLMDYLKQNNAADRIRKTFVILIILLVLLDLIPGLFSNVHKIFLPAVMIYLVAHGIYQLLRIQNRFSKAPVRDWQKIFLFLLLGALCCDLILFQKALYISTPDLLPGTEAAMKSVYVNKLEYVDRRGKPPTERQENAFLLLKGTLDQYCEQYEAGYAFAQAEACHFEAITGLSTAPVKDFFDADIPKSEKKNEIQGCSAPKVRILANAKFFDTTKEIADYIRQDNMSHQVALLKSPSAPRQKPETPPAVGTVSAGDFQVKKFTSDSLEGWAHIQKGGGWLVYADADHPGWRAYVDGRATDIFNASIAFKAIFVPEGKHQVRFVFSNNLTSVLSYVFGIIGLLAGAAALFLVGMIGLRSFDLADYLSRIFRE